MRIGTTFAGKAVAYVLAVLVSLRLGLGLYAWDTANRLEQPNFSVLCKLPGGVELRQYDPYLIAETEVASGPMRESTGKGFRTVAAYLFGKNKARGSGSEKMAMTAPVRSSSGGEKMSMTAPVRSSSGGEKMSMTAPVRSSGGDKTKISFVMPSKYSMRTAPRPIDRAVRLRQVKPHFMAARTFSGPPPGEARVQREREKVLQALGDRSLRPEGDAETLVLGYHDPFMTPNFLRRNEVGIFVDGDSVRSAGLTSAA